MKQFEVNHQHVKEQFELRNKQFAVRSDEIIARVTDTLEKNTPTDWRFTESPHSRFFIVEELTNAKFMGLSYRNGPEGRRIVETVQDNTRNLEYLYDNFTDYVSAYIDEVRNPELPIIHQIRTVYPRKKGGLAEEMRLAEETKSLITHTLPLASRKIASRPNAVVTRDGELWVRQYLNWVGMQPGSKEYYLFYLLTPEGIQPNRCAIFSYSESGQLTMLHDKQFDICFPRLSDIKNRVFDADPKIKNPVGLRSESYWRVPTYLDRRLIDLEFKERQLNKRPDLAFWRESRLGVSAEILERYFLEKIVAKARKRLYSR